jgi:heptose I phosphotransferase
MIIELCPELQQIFSVDNAFDKIMTMDGEIFRSHKERRTLRFVHDGNGYFLKIHGGIGWREIVKNLLFLKLPVLSAQNEYRAIKCLEKLDVRTMEIAGFGLRGNNPAKIDSFLITREIENAISLEDLVKDWRLQSPDPALKRELIIKIAEIARKLHQNGLNHRDFYICHFLLDKSWLDMRNYDVEPPLYLIDLHRTHIRSRTPLRWIIKDIAGIYFSSMDVPLTKRDLFRFMTHYEKKPLEQILNSNSAFWLKTTRKARQLYMKHS